MEADLINLRERAMDRADRALDSVWPERKGENFVREMQSASKDIEEIGSAMLKEDVELVEQSRTYRYLGSIYSDLTPALGSNMLLKARDAYLKAEALLKDGEDELEHAKLNFNLANTLRQMDPPSIEQLQEAKRRLLFAKKIFAEQVPQSVPQVDTALWSVESRLKIVPLAKEVDRNKAEMATLEKELKEGGDPSDMIKKVKKRLGGFPELIGKVQILMNQMPPELQQSEKFDEISTKMSALTKLAIGGDSMDNHEAQIIQMLRDRLKSELNIENVSEDRAETMRGFLEQLGIILSGDDEELVDIMDKGKRVKDLAEVHFDALHYLSHGIPRPPEGSRAAELVENCWWLRRFILEEMYRPNKGPEESKEILGLHEQASRVDKRIYEAGADDIRAKVVDKEAFRPFALTVRNFSAQIYSMLSQPIWPVAPSPVDTNAVFYSGSLDLQDMVTDVCGALYLKVMQTPSGESFANARWKQIQKAMTTVFDLRVADGPELASVAYELGIALTLGKPMVVIAANDQVLPFDIDVEPAILSGDHYEEKKLASAIDRSIVWTYDRTRSREFLNTLDYILSQYTRPFPDIYVDQTLKLLSDQKKDPDRSTINRSILKFVDFLNDVNEGTTMLIYPVWSPVYPKANSSRVFHVMPFRPEWADDVALITRKTCKALDVEYVRGDEVEDPNVIRSIWKEIAQATHVVIDLTGFNANVALELGITHTIGRPSLIVGQPDTVEQLFPMIEKLRVHTYKDTTELGALVRNFLT